MRSKRIGAMRIIKRFSVSWPPTQLLARPSNGSPAALFVRFQASVDHARNALSESCVVPDFLFGIDAKAHDQPQNVTPVPTSEAVAFPANGQEIAEGRRALKVMGHHMVHAPPFPENSGAEMAPSSRFC
ncbi:MAG TPA: hypothetical protein VES67_26385 [Vicinamibacterales bacterium]|nr:hypothetical protein [Vicinamibacterales bacterium]